MSSLKDLALDATSKLRSQYSRGFLSSSSLRVALLVELADQFLKIAHRQLNATYGIVGLQFRAGSLSLSRLFSRITVAVPQLFGNGQDRVWLLSISFSNPGVLSSTLRRRGA